jgi:hypothetical protein
MRIHLAIFAVLAACTPDAPSPATPAASAGSTPLAAPPPLPLLVSVDDMMLGTVGFSAHVIDKVAESKHPSAGDWGAAQAASRNLIAAATLLTHAGARNVADGLRKLDREWRPLAQDLQDAGLRVSAAAGAQDEAALDEAVLGMRKTCQACHMRFGVDSGQP